MLAKEDIEYLNLTRTALVMSDIDVLAATIKSTLREVAKQASALGVGLQNVAPGDKIDAPNNSVQYLLNIADELVKLADHDTTPQSTVSQDK